MCKKAENRPKTQKFQQGIGRSGKVAFPDGDIEQRDDQRIVVEIFLVFAHGIALEQDPVDIIGRYHPVLQGPFVQPGIGVVHQFMVVDFYRSPDGSQGLGVADDIPVEKKGLIFVLRGIIGVVRDDVQNDADIECRQELQLFNKQVFV